jgi:hypothetical protein
MQFGQAIQILTDAGVEFVVIGGVSATFHGSARVTYDLNICYSRSQQNVRCLTAARAPFHPRPRGVPFGLPFIWDEAALRNSTILTLQTDMGEIDLLTEMAGLGDFGEVKAHSLLVDAFQRQLATLTLPGLILAKRAAGRDKDRLALPELESLLEASCGEDEA